MKMKFDKVFQVLEAQVEKIILAVVAIACLFLLWMYVVGNPYGTEVDGKKRPPGQIDRYVKQKSEQLLQNLNGSADPLLYDKNYVRQYDQLQQSTVEDVSVAVSIPYPSVGDQVIQEDRLYAIPAIPELTDVQIETMRGAAQIPDEDVGPDRPYDSVVKSPGDLDLITVSARLNVEALFNSFEQSFMGPRLKSSWKDSRLAKPVFARLGLERRKKLDDGRWGQWQEVPPTQISTHHQLFSDLPLTLDKSQFGVEIWMSQFDTQEVQHEILQPQAYEFTVSRTDWMAPEYLDEMLNIMEREQQQEKRKELEQRRTRSERDTTTRGRRTTTRPTPRPRPGGRDQQDQMMNMMLRGEGAGAVPRATTRKERTTKDVERDFEQELLDEKSRLETRRDLLLVWAHDDTAEPGQTYQYRIRAGLFNPIAGKDWFTTEQAELKDRIVLWSRYSEPTEEVSIPKRIYVFPKDVVAAADQTDRTNGVKLEVMKYYLGLWRDFEFDVFPGETIGYEVEDDSEESTPANAELMPMPGMTLAKDNEMVDFATGYTLIDIKNRVSWGTRLRPDSFSQMLYYDGMQMQIMPIGQSNWSDETRSQYRTIQDEMDQDVQRKNPRMGPGGTPGIEMIDPMMMMDPMIGG